MEYAKTPGDTDSDCRTYPKNRPDSEIASIFDISEHTAKFHIKNILRKLDASNRCHALAIAAQKGLIEL
ncbi:MAG: helix-turn-helix transcriptional regulator [Nitrospirae bacterium]|nr:helix-turn-helix transcriptional regulator [Nitrospirota bacterium]